MSLLNLIEEAQKSDLTSLEELLRRQEGFVFSMLFHLNASPDCIDDLAQEVMMRVARSIKNLKKKENFKCWITQIIYNVFYDDLRKKKRRPMLLSIDNFYEDAIDSHQKDIEDKKIHTEEKLKNIELNEVIRTAIVGLEEHFREVVVLRELEGLSYDRIAFVLNTNVGTVKSRLARARMKLRQKLKNYIE